MARDIEYIQSKNGGPILASIDKEAAKLRDIYFCNACRTLNLGMPRQPTKKCKYCGDCNIVVRRCDEQGYAELARLRFGNQLKG